MASSEGPQPKRRKIIAAEGQTLEAAQEFTTITAILRSLAVVPPQLHDSLLVLDALVQRYITAPETTKIPERFLSEKIPTSGLVIGPMLSMAALVVSKPSLIALFAAQLIQEANVAYTKFCEAYNKSSKPLMSPSEYCKHINWANQQRRNRRLLCGRPAHQRGIPLSTLHDVFRRFIIEVDMPLPSDDVANQALRTAFTLCTTMGDPYTAESARSDQFDECVSDLFSEWANQQRISPDSEVYSGIVDRTLRFGFGSTSISLILREDKNDIDDGGDVYLQVARDYDMYCKTITEMHKAIGAPTFLVCVMGPILIVSGAFFDGKNVIIEPLTNSCHMLCDETGRRQTALAKVFYLTNPTQVPTPAPSTPRLYLDCVSVDKKYLIGTLSDFKPTEYLPRLLFTANLNRSNANPEKVLVKLVSRPYGVQVHTFLAAHGYAPSLYGYKDLEGAPTAYVMEFLDSNWTSLAKLAEKKRAALVQSPVLLPAIRATISHITTLLSGATMVHGDLRPNNIMIKLGEDTDNMPVVSEGVVQLRVVDFDWAGDVGRARYPPQRNEDIEGLKWPGRPGNLIDAGDDVRVVDSWWRSFQPVD
ncbi:hypothetical protein ONZ45_g10917 [Pleurotus djamor]|nr:hypothetical protein ONZ45_g10917 [Pleurotus djamor]